jgi:hypothetical protein
LGLCLVQYDRRAGCLLAGAYAQEKLQESQEGVSCRFTVTPKLEMEKNIRAKWTKKKKKKKNRIVVFVFFNANVDTL